MKFSLKALAVSLSMTFLPSLPATAQVMPEVDAPISGTRVRASLIYQRIAGVKIPIDSQELKDMEQLMNDGRLAEASAIPTNNPNFINVTVKHFATRMSTREETVTAPLSDFVATVMGFVRDGSAKDARDLLTTNNIYVADQARLPANANVGSNVVDDIIQSNNHYEDLDREARENNLDIGSVLVEQRQQTLNSAGAAVPLPDAAGIYSSRAYVEAHAVAGTNRRMVHHAFRNFLCTDVTEWADTTLPSVYIGRDVDRAPGGVPATFNTTCKGCHSPLDAMRGNTAHIDYDDGGFVKHGTLLNRGNGDTEFSANAETPTIARKFSNNAEVAPSGYVTTDASWINNLSNFGSKASFFGWRNMPTDGRGVGMKRFGQMMAESRAFSTCMVKRVYRSVCKREVTGLEGDFITIAANEFEQDYNLRNLFQYVARSPACIGN